LTEFKKYAIIAAGGSGTRMGGGVPKQFLQVQGRTVLWYSLETFLRAYEDLQIILVLPQGHTASGQSIIQSTQAPDRIQVVEGGPTRFHSVKNGLSRVQQPSVVFVHDAVRCLLTVQLIHRCYDMTLEKGNAIPAVGAVDSMRIMTEEASEALDRRSVRVIQTPQTFHSDIIKTAYDQDYLESFTDDAMVVEQLGVPINLIDGEETNIKITRPIDLVIMEKFMGVK